MIKRQLTMIYEDDDLGLCTVCFQTWKALHMFLFEKGVYHEFQVFDDGEPVLHYITKGVERNKFILHWHESVPASVLFEIVNKHASAQLN